ncbi:MAG TPA: hypothetical protein VND65_09405 [Candidatus Binatia bacterium]|nr:hypothetical protein [Candidatus Binatia bacterium]
MKLRLAVGALTILFVHLSLGPLSAQTAVNWTGTSGGNWNTPSDWSGGVVPNNGGGKTYNVTIAPGASQTVDLNLGVTISDLTLGSSSGSAVTLQSVANDSLTLAANGNFTVNATATLMFDTVGSNLTIGSGGTLTNSGVIDLEAAGESLSVNGATTNNLGATITLEGGIAATFTGNVSNSGNFQTGFTGGTNSVTVTGTFTNNAGANVTLYSSADSLSVDALSNSGFLQVGDASGSGATLTITGGGQGITDVVAGSTIELYGNLNLVNSGKTTSALANLNTVAGTLDLNNSQTTAITPSGGTLTINSGGAVQLSDLASSTTALTLTGNVNNSGSFTTGFKGGGNTVNVSGTFTNNSGGLLELYASDGGTDAVNIATLSNSGTVTLAASGATLDITGSGTLTNSGAINLTLGKLEFSASSATITGNGTLTLGNSSGTETGTIQAGPGDTGTLTLSSGTITGYGNIGNGTLTLVNKGSIDANGQVTTGALTVQPGSGAMANSGTLEATNQGTLILEGTYNNTGGTIEALGESGGTGTSTVELTAGTVINGGTLTTTTAGSSSGQIEATGAVTLNGVTNLGAYAVNSGTTTTLEGAITNSGSITLSSSTLSIANNVSLNGKGTVVLSNSSANFITGAKSGLTLTNANTIEGSGTISNLGIVNTGTISADQSTPLLILPSSAGLNNEGTLSVSTGSSMQVGTSAGGALLNYAGNTLTGGAYNVSGILQFGAKGTSIVTDAANISLTGSSAEIEDFSGENVLTNLATIASAGSFTLSSGANFTTAGNFTNNGKLTVNSGDTFKVTGSLTNFNSSTSTLTGGAYTVGGKLDFAGANIVTDAANITLNGSGEIVNSSNNKNALMNFATIASSGSFTLASKANFTTTGNLTNNGKLTVNSGTSLSIAGDLTNFNSSTDTLTSGTYTIGGSMNFTGANIVTNAANLTLTGNNAKILNGTENGLANFANNTGSFTLSGNGTFSTGPATFTNSNKLTVTTGSTLNIGGGGNAYTQSAGTTTIDGTLTANGGVTATAGTILGAGKINGAVTIGGSGDAPTISAGDSGKAGLLALTGSYTQLSSGTINAFIGGTTVGTQYSQLQVSGSASLAGTITVTLAGGFTPTIGSTFTVLTASSITGTFSNSTIAINSSEHFDVSYTSTGVVLTVVSGSAPQGGSTAARTVLAPSRQRVAHVSAPAVHGGALHPASPRMLIARSGSELGRSNPILEVNEYRLSKIESPGVLGYGTAGTAERLSGGVSTARAFTKPASTRPLIVTNASHNNWAAPLQAHSPLRLSPHVRHEPVRILSPSLPHVGR